MAKLKGMDFKALLLNHGEKIGAALIVLLGLTGLATASWTPSTKQPEELKAAAEKNGASAQYAASNIGMGQRKYPPVRRVFTQLGWV